MLVADELTAAEQRLVHATSHGLTADLRGSEALCDPGRGASWGPERTIRAELVARLLTDSEARTPLRLAGARITGLLDLEGATLSRWLLLTNCWMDDPVILAHAAAPLIRMAGCHLPGLLAENLQIDADLSLDQGFTVRGQVNVARARIGGVLCLDGAMLDNPGAIALDAARLTAGHHVRLGDGFHARGAVHFPGAQIHGDLVLAGASIVNPGDTALTTDQSQIAQSVLAEGLVTEGAIRVCGARIGGSLTLAGARLTHTGDWAVTASGLQVTQEMHLGGGFTARGGIDLQGAHLGALIFDGAELDNPNGFALEGGWLTVDRQISCRRGFTARGEFSLYGARVGARVDLREASFTNPGGLALDLERLNASALYLLPHRAPDGLVDLSHAQIGTLHDDPSAWSAHLDLRGLVYQTLINDDVPVRARLNWLERQQHGYAPQPYDQLAAAYRQAGQEDAARLVAIHKQRRRRRTLNPAGRLLDWLLYLTVGYGYRTWLAALWLLALLALGTAVFTHSYPTHMTAAGTPTPAFHAIAYTLDVLVPIVDLGQQKAWLPTGSALYCSWLLSAAGWVLTTAVAAGLSGVLKRN
ncbi:oxidoreductase [Streptomyces sp. NPDC015532]|uniref:oxidoreductase n=1 Tax=Streptomyces sp. NPDC015532 TaxID=3364960 RepID=UPI0037026964